MSSRGKIFRVILRFLQLDATGMEILSFHVGFGWSTYPPLMTPPEIRVKSNAKNSGKAMVKPSCDHKAGFFSGDGR